MAGNPAMRSKRVHGPSAQRTLILSVVLERCHVKGCDNPVIVTRNPTAITKQRACIDHVRGKESKTLDVTKLLTEGY